MNTAIPRKIPRVRFSEVSEQPIHHKQLPPDIVARVEVVRNALSDVVEQTLEVYLDDLKRDVDPGAEVEVWEAQVAEYQSFCNVAMSRTCWSHTDWELPRDVKRAIFAIVCGIQKWWEVMDDVGATEKVTSESH